MPDGAEPLSLHDVRDADRRTHELLEQVLAELRALRGDRDERMPRRLSRLDDARLGPLLAEISAGIGDATFKAAELLHHAQRSDPRLLGAIANACGGIDDGTTRRLGRLLARAADAIEVVGGFRVEIIAGDGRDGAEWRVVVAG